MLWYSIRSASDDIRFLNTMIKAILPSFSSLHHTLSPYILCYKVLVICTVSLSSSLHSLILLQNTLFYSILTSFTQFHRIQILMSLILLTILFQYFSLQITHYDSSHYLPKLFSTFVHIATYQYFPRICSTEFHSNASYRSWWFNISERSRNSCVIDIWGSLLTRLKMYRFHLFVISFYPLSGCVIDSIDGSNCYCRQTDFFF